MRTATAFALALALAACSGEVDLAEDPDAPGGCDGSGSPEEQRAACDDGDPCTADRCLAAECVHSTVGNCASAP